MKPDPEYVKRILSAFQDSSEPALGVMRLNELGFSLKGHDLIFHLRLLNDHGYIVREDGELGLGIESTLNGLSISTIPLRLTAGGHEFAESLNNATAFAAVKRSAITSSLSIIRDIAVTIVKGELARQGFL